MNEWNKLLEGLYEGTSYFADALMRKNDHQNSEKARKANLWRSKPALPDLNSLLDSSSKYSQDIFSQNKKLLEIYEKLINPVAFSPENDSLALDRLKGYYKLLGIGNNFR